MLGCVLLSTSCAPKSRISAPEALSVFWGSTAEVSAFLESPQAQAERWECRAIE
jgi:hypothetical protein